MPLPTPNQGESEQDFISRCMGNDTMNEEFPDQKQRSAVCYRQWRGEKGIDYEAEIELVRNAWYAAHQGPEVVADTVSDIWVRTVYSDAIIVELGGKMYRVSYIKDTDDKVIFAPRAEWQEVERAYVPAKSNALKAISKTDGELTVANYIVLFGGRDLEGIGSPHVNQDGSKGEYFTPQTELESSYTKTGRLYVDWEHGADDVDPDDVLGYVDWSTAKADDRGVWVQRVLNRRNKYVAWLEDLIEDGLIGTSSEAVRSRIKKGTDGQIIRWPLRRDTLTVTPMEPRMLTENYIQAFKALGLPVPEQLEPEPEAAPEAVQTAAAVGKVAADILLFSIKALQEE